MSTVLIVQTCSDCGGRTASGWLVCARCGQPFEDDTWVNTVWVTVVLAGLVEVVAHLTGLRPWSLVQLFMNETSFMVLGYTGLKVLQKVRDPARPVLDEALSVFSTRGMRLVLLLMLLMLGLAFAMAAPLGTWSEGAPGVWRWLRYALVIPATPLLVALCIWRFGLGFFDLRVAQPLRRRPPAAFAGLARKLDEAREIWTEQGEE